MARIYGDDKLKLSYDNVVKFFEDRARKSAVVGDLSAVIYQDKNPELAINRDIIEKKLLLPKLGIDQSSIVFDADCGTGRWAQEIIPYCGQYYGADISNGFIEIASKKFKSYKNAHFFVSPLWGRKILSKGFKGICTHALSFGVMIYMNDEELKVYLDILLHLMSEKALIAFREPIGVAQRLSIIEHFSDDMEQEYNAIYRTELELFEMIDSVFNHSGFSLKESGDVHSAALSNRSDTKQKYYIYQR